MKIKTDIIKFLNQPITICLISTVGLFIITTFYQWNQNRIDLENLKNELIRSVSIELSVRSAVIINDIDYQISLNEKNSETLNYYTAHLLSSLVKRQESTKISPLKDCYVKPEYKTSSIYALLCELAKYDKSADLQRTLAIIGSYFYVSQSLRIGENSKPGLEYLRQLKSILQFYLPIEYSNRLLVPFPKNFSRVGPR